VRGVFKPTKTVKGVGGETGRTKKNTPKRRTPRGTSRPTKKMGGGWKKANIANKPDEERGAERGKKMGKTKGKKQFANHQRNHKKGGEDGGLRGWRGVQTQRFGGVLTEGHKGE